MSLSDDNDSSKSHNGCCVAHSANDHHVLSADDAHNAYRGRYSTNAVHHDGHGDGGDNGGGYHHDIHNGLNRTGFFGDFLFKLGHLT